MINTLAFEVHLTTIRLDQPDRVFEQHALADTTGANNDRCLAVVQIKTRSQKGAVQLQRAFPKLARNDVRDYRSALADILREPRQWANCLVYLYVILVTKLRAYWLNHVRDLGEWERDETSRSTPR